MAYWASAEPQLQLYIPGSTYQKHDPDAWQEESWVYSDDGKEVDLWLLAYNRRDPIQNVRIAVAVRGDELVEGNSVSVSWAAGEPTGYPNYPGGDPFYGLDTPTPHYIPQTGAVTLQAADFTVGYPQIGEPPDTSDMPAHGVYPTPFAELYMGKLNTPSGVDQIWDAIGVPLEDATSFKNGVIYKLHVEVHGFTCVHFDAHDGTYDRKNSATFAPFSHDADGNFGNGVIPEPATMLLLGTIFVGGIGYGLKRRAR
jgi:hypothetical protein